MNKKPWDKETPLYSETADKYFFTVDDLANHCFNYGCTIESLDLRLTKPLFAIECTIDADDHFEGVMPDSDSGIDVPEELQDAVKEFNDALAAYTEPLSYFPINFAPDYDFTIED